MRKIHVVLSAPSMFRFMRGQPAKLRHLGYDVTLVAAASATLDQSCKEEGCDRIEVGIPRNISPIADLRAFLALARLWARTRPDAVMLSGPKAIFLGSLAAFIADVPVRLSVYHGMRQETLRFPMRGLINACDRAAFLASTAVLAVSRSLVEAVKAEGNDPWDKVRPIQPGTANGIRPEDVGYTPAEAVGNRARVRAQFGIGEHHRVLLFLGRLTEDKGLLELPEIFRNVSTRHPGTRLIVVGCDEVNTSFGKAAIGKLAEHPKVHLIGHVTDVGTYIAVADLLVFPSHREGFGMAIIESGIYSLPTIAYDVTGVRDAVVDGESGRLVPLGDVAQFSRRIMEYLDNSQLLAMHGAAARHHASKFTPEAVWPNYRTILGDS